MIQAPGGDQPDRPGQINEVEPLEEVREAAGAVIGSLKRLLEATEKVVADPASFDQAVAGGKSLIDAFTNGFVTDSSRPDAPSGEAEKDSA